MDARISEKIDRATNIMNLWDRDFVEHVRDSAAEGSESHIEAESAMRGVGQWMATSGLLTRDDRGDWVRREGREVGPSTSLEEFEGRYDEMLEAHDRIAPDLSNKGFQKYVEGVEIARSEDLSGPKKGMEASEGALDDFLGSVPEDQVKAMKVAGFNDQDMAGQYLIHAMLTSNEKEIDRIVDAGVDLGTPMSDKFSKAISEDSPEGLHLSHYAALLGDNMPEASLARIAPEKSGLDKRDAEGNTPLHYAAMTSDEAHLKVWLDKGPDPRARNAEGLSPSQSATIYGATQNVPVLETAAREARMGRIRQAAERKERSENPTPKVKAAKSKSSGREPEL